MKAVHESLVEMFGEVTESNLAVHGRTDHGIMTDVFAGIGRDYQQHREHFDQLYWSKLPDVMANSNGQLLPGVTQLLEHHLGRAGRGVRDSDWKRSRGSRH